MWQLVGHECHKLLHNLWTSIALLLCVLIYALFAYSSMPPSMNDYHNVHSYYKAGQGTVTENRLTEAKEGMIGLNKLYDEGVRFTDRQLGQWLLYRDRINASSQKNSHVSLQKTLKGGQGKVQRLQYSMLEKTGPVTTAFYIEGWRSVVSYWQDIGYYLVVVLGIFVLSRVFPEERVTGMAALVHSTMEGRRKLVLAKIVTGMIYIASVTAILAVCDLVANAFYYGLAGWNAPLKNLFFQTPYAVSILQYWLTRMLIGAVAASIFGLLAMLVSVVTGNGIAAVACGGGAFLLYDLLTRSATAAAGSKALVLLDFLRLRSFYASYENIYQLFGNAIPYEWVLCIVEIMILAALTGTIYYMEGKHGTDKT